MKLLSTIAAVMLFAGVSAQATLVLNANSNTANGAIGRVENGVATDPAHEEVMVNTLVDLANSTSVSLFSSSVGDKTYSLLNNPAQTLSFASFVTSGGVGKSNLINLGSVVGTYAYLSVKYDGAQGSALIWDVSTLSGVVQVPGMDQGYGNNNYSLFSAAVPEGGATVALLGFAITGLGVGRRFLKS
jgi:hypothetical protein